MTEHNIFYYPYASFTNTQLPLLKAAALYFDKLYILDPLKATSGTIGLGGGERDVALLEEAEILERIKPEDIVKKYEKEIEDAVRADMEDSDFLELCEASGRAPLWRLALAKVPASIRNDPKHQPSDQAMKQLMGDLPRKLASGLGRYTEVSVKGLQRDLSVYRETPVGEIEYRYNDYPLPLGEAIMMNHALFAGLLHAAATPITDDPFHNKALSLKLRRAAQEPEVRQVLEDRARKRQLAFDWLATATLTDSQLNLPVLNPKLPLEEVLEYRHKHDAALQAVRNKLDLMARGIRTEPWDQEFVDTLEHETIPAIIAESNKVGKARDSYLKSPRVRQMLKALNLAAGTAIVVLTVCAAALTPAPLVAAGLSLFTGVAIPAAEWLLDGPDGKRAEQENGLHYLLMYR